MRTFGFGVVGLGSIAKAHLDAIDKLPNARLVGVTSHSPGKAEVAARQHQVKAYPDVASMLLDPEVEVVCVTTPSGTHLEPALAAARAGRHVIVEKPLEVTVERARAIVRAADAAGVKLATIFMSRFSDAHQHLKRSVEEGKLGRMLQGDAYVKWYRSQAYYDSAAWRGTWALDGGGALMNQAIHQLDLLLWLMGPVAEVFAYTATLNHERLEVEDTLVAVLRFESGALGSISAATSLYPGQPKVLELHGTAGTVRMKDDGVDLWQLADLTDGEQAEVLRRYSGQASGTFADPMAMSFDNHRRQIHDFLQAIGTDAAPLVDGREGLRLVTLVEAIYRAAQTKKPVTLTTP